MALVPHPSPPGVLGLQPPHLGQYNGAAPVDAHMQRQRLLSQLNESTWQRIGKLVQLFLLSDTRLICFRLLE